MCVFFICIYVYICGYFYVYLCICVSVCVCSRFYLCAFRARFDYRQTVAYSQMSGVYKMYLYYYIKKHQHKFILEMIYNMSVRYLINSRGKISNYKNVHIQKWQYVYIFVNIVDLIWIYNTDFFIFNSIMIPINSYQFKKIIHENLNN